MDVIFTFIDAKINFEICIIYIKNASSHNHFHSYISLTERVNFCTFCSAAVAAAVGWRVYLAHQQRPD